MNISIVTHVNVSSPICLLLPIVDAMVVCSESQQHMTSCIYIETDCLQTLYCLMGHSASYTTADFQQVILMPMALVCLHVEQPL